MKCKLCGADVEFLKPNTHYISSFLIQRCLDEKGIARKGRYGSYYDIHPLFSEYRFERDTPPDSIEKNLHCPSSNEENERNRNNHPCSVNDCFCSKCENIFCDIERDYCNSIHNKVIKHNVYSFASQFNGIFRTFFYLQFYRTILVRNESQFIAPKTLNILKSAILDYPNVDSIDGFYDLPISVSRLITEGDDMEYTTNIIVDFLTWYNPHIIFMNDFVVQLYDDATCLPFVRLFGINCIESYKSYITLGKSDFQFQVIADSNRRSINKQFYEFWAEIRRVATSIQSIINLPSIDPILPPLLDFGLRHS